MSKIDLLRPKTKQLCNMLIEECKKQGLIIEVIETLRKIEVQDAYYAQGRESINTVNDLRKKAGLNYITEAENEHKITNAKGGSSAHNYGLAFDVCPIVRGKLAWGRVDLFKKIGDISRNLQVDEYKLVWGGDFKSIKDSPHFEMENWKKYK